MTASRNENAPSPDRLEHLNSFLSHLRLPPAVVSDGVARLEFVVDEIHLRHGGIVHGGVYATVLDTVAGYAAYSVAPPGADVVTMQLNMNMTAGAKVGERIVATAHAVHSGRRTAVIQGELRRSDGKLLITGSATMFFVGEGLAS
jgi:uncharacterized protein (TIGR00369 family)